MIKQADNYGIDIHYSSFRKSKTWFENVEQSSGLD